MTAIKATRDFADGLKGITSLKVEHDLRKTVEALGQFPELGSGNVPNSIKQLYGNNIRKINVGPFLLVYHYSKEEDAISLYGLIHNRMAQ